MEISGLKGEALRQAIDVAVLRKGLDAQKAQGQAAISLIEQAGQVARSAAAAVQRGSGHSLDVYI